MDIERLFMKKSLSFIILSTKSEHALSALDFFDKNFCLQDIDQDQREEYRDFWASILMDNINLLPQEKKNMISISFVEPQTAGTGFRFPGDVMRYDIICSSNWKKH